MVDRGFDSIAKYYDRLARLVFGASVIKSQTYFLDRIPASSSVLVLGGGTGWWMKEFLANRPACRILYIEVSARMIQLAKRSVGDDRRVRFVQGTEGLLTAADRFDVVITFYFLDLFPGAELQEVVNKIARSIKPDGLWLVADFTKTRWWHSPLLLVMYRFFRLVSGVQNQSLPNWTGLLSRRDLKELDHKTFFGDFIKTVLYRIDR